jgi:hypothetical protein
MTAEKIVVINEESKDIRFAIVNAFDTASAFQIFRVTRNEMILKKAQNLCRRFTLTSNFSIELIKEYV